MLYPVAIEPGTDSSVFGVVFPDVPGCFSAGDSMDEALENAKEALLLHLEELANDGQLPPVASSVSERFGDPEYAGWVWALVDVDVTPFMGKASKINVTLPDLLTLKIDAVVGENKAYKSRSHFLQVAASNELNRASA